MQKIISPLRRSSQTDAAHKCPVSIPNTKTKTLIRPKQKKQEQTLA